MRRVVIILAALAMTGAIVFVWQASAPDTCPTTMEHNGVSYDLYEVSEEITGRGAMRNGTQRGCGHEGSWSEDLALMPIAGVDPRTALVTPVAARALYVAHGVSINELPGKISRLVVQ